MNNTSQLSILLIDENPRSRWEIIAAFLSVGLTAEVIIADELDTPKELFAGTRKFNMIVADPYAYRGHAVELIAALRNYALSKRVPVLIYSACDQKDWNGSICITKPAHSAVLAGALLRTLPQDALTGLPTRTERAGAIADS